MQLNERGIPKRLWLHFHSDAKGKLARIKSRTMREVAGPVVPVHSVPVELRTTTLTLDRKTGVYCRRKQLPVMQARAITLQKSQGGIYSQVVY